MILIAYDGSSDAQAAIQRAGELLKEESATILTVWERFIDAVTRGGGVPVGQLDYEALDRSYEDQARQRVEEGTKLGPGCGRARTRSRGPSWLRPTSWAPPRSCSEPEASPG